LDPLALSALYAEPIRDLQVQSFFGSDAAKEQPSRTQCQKVRVKTGEERASKGEEKQSNKFQPNTSSKSQIKSLS
jgi:hypothetical protein